MIQHFEGLLKVGKAKYLNCPFKCFETWKFTTDIGKYRRLQSQHERCEQPDQGSGGHSEPHGTRTGSSGHGEALLDAGKKELLEIVIMCDFRSSKL